MNKEIKNNYPTVTIFGRTNVGKSTFFNCITERHHAITSNVEGTTRDSNLAVAEWTGRKFNIIDTGGIIDINYLDKKKKNPDDIDARVQKKVAKYIKDSDLILFLVDSKIGILPGDKELSKFLSKRYKEKMILVANKADSMKQRHDAVEFNKLGLGEPICISSANGSGTGDLLDIIVKKIKARKIRVAKIDPSTSSGLKKKEEKTLNVCLIGRPNVGKSSLLNSLLGYERVIVSPIAHTTREPQDTVIEYKKNKIKIIDTAGINKRGKVSKGLEKHGILKSLSSLRKSDVAFLVIDISKTLTHQDQRLFEEISTRGASLIFIANKWDLVKDRNTKDSKMTIYRKFPFARWVPIQFTSAKTGEKVNKLLDLALELNEKRTLDLTDATLSKFLNRLVKIHRPTKAKGTKRPRIYELKQLKVNPPIFEIRIGPKDTIADSYVRFIENRIREKFSLEGTPIKIKISKKLHTHGRSDLEQFEMDKKKEEKKENAEDKK